MNTNLEDDAWYPLLDALQLSLTMTGDRVSEGVAKFEEKVTGLHYRVRVVGFDATYNTLICHVAGDLYLVAGYMTNAPYLAIIDGSKCKVFPTNLSIPIGMVGGMQSLLKTKYKDGIVEIYDIDSVEPQKCGKDFLEQVKK